MCVLLHKNSTVQHFYYMSIYITRGTIACSMIKKNKCVNMLRWQATTKGVNNNSPLLNTRSDGTLVAGTQVFPCQFCQMGESSFMSFPPLKGITGWFFTWLFNVHAHFLAELLTQRQTLSCWVSFLVLQLRWLLDLLLSCSLEELHSQRRSHWAFDVSLR